MKVKAVIKKIKTHFKKQGVDIDVEYNGTRWSFEHNSYVGSFLANGAMASDEKSQLEASACNFHIRRCNDHSDSQSDYFAGSFRDNATQMVESILPKPSKFKVGQLVRGKDNKRANRQGYAGSVGMVTDATTGDYVSVKWMGKNSTRNRSGYNNHYPERDLEVMV
jgi:hypothetical protein